MIQAAAKGVRLSHLHDVVLNLFFGEGVRIIGKVPEEMAKILSSRPSTRNLVISMFMCILRCQYVTRGSA